MFRRSLAAAAVAVATLGAGAASAEAAQHAPAHQPPAKVVSPAVPLPATTHSGVSTHTAQYPPVHQPPKVVVVKPGVSGPKTITVGAAASVHAKGFKKGSVLTVKIVLPNHKTVVKHVKANSKGEANTPGVKVTRTGTTVIYVTGVDVHNKKHTFRVSIVVKAKPKHHR
jgi:hypothetical protein